MKKIYSSVLFVVPILFLAGCSKDVFKSYERRLIGTWRIVDINRVGIGGGSSVFPLDEGTIVFNRDGSLIYLDVAGNSYEGRWDIQRTRWDGDTELCSLQITAVDFNSQRVIGEYYDDIRFRSTNHFVGKIQAPWRTFVTHFRR